MKHYEDKGCNVDLLVWYKTNQLPTCNNKYLSDVEYEDEGTDEDDSAKPITVEKMVDGVSKQFIKGERLKYYPAGMNLYSSSRDMKKPVIEEMTNAKAMECIGDAEMVYRETYAIGNKEKGNLIDKRYYKKTSENKG